MLNLDKSKHIQNWVSVSICKGSTKKRVCVKGAIRVTQYIPNFYLCFFFFFSFEMLIQRLIQPSIRASFHTSFQPVVVQRRSIYLDNRLWKQLPLSKRIGIVSTGLAATFFLGPMLLVGLGGLLAVGGFRLWRLKRTLDTKSGGFNWQMHKKFSKTTRCKTSFVGLAPNKAVNNFYTTDWILTDFN
ncbi:unnamed protein product [Rhizopus stolonifer]